LKKRDATTATIKEIYLNSGQRTSLLDDEEILQDVLRDDESIIVFFENQGKLREKEKEKEKEKDKKKEIKVIPSGESSSSEEEKPVPKKKVIKKPAPKKRTPAKKKIPARKLKKRDPNFPKRPKTAYIFYNLERRDILNNDELTFGALSRKIANEWKALSQEAKKTYVDKHLEDKKRYEKEMKMYERNKKSPAKKSDTESSSEEESIDDKKKKRKVNEKKPNRHMNAYMIFQKDKRDMIKENPNLKGSVARKIGDIWRAMSDEEKQHYINLAEKDMERYNRENEEYKKLNES